MFVKINITKKGYFLIYRVPVLINIEVKFTFIKRKYLPVLSTMTQHGRSIITIGLAAIYRGFQKKATEIKILISLDLCVF